MKTRADLEKEIGTLERARAVAESRLSTIDRELAEAGIGPDDDIGAKIEQTAALLKGVEDDLEAKEAEIEDLLERAETIVND